MYEHIDMKKTGILLKYRIEKAGYTVKDIQKILQLSCPQPIYRWFKGMILPYNKLWQSYFSHSFGEEQMYMRKEM